MSQLLTEHPLENYKPGKPQYEGVELTDEEVAEALRLMRREKQRKENEKQWRQDMNKTYEPVKMNAMELRDYIPKCFPDINPDLQKEQFDLLVNYFSGPEPKGLLLFGGVGVGKTKLMEAFEWNPKASYAVKSCREISALFSNKNGGYEAIQPMKGIMNGQRNDFNHTKYGICFDDMGEEKSQKHFGNEANVMEEIILARYRNKEIWQYTHITTNLTADKLKEVYGDRVVSRMREMFLQIDFSNIKDLRK